MLKLTIVGAAGRMGRRLVALATESADLGVAGAVDVPDCPFLGHDAGRLAGVRELGVALSADLGAAIAAADVVVDFSGAAKAVETARAVVAAGRGYVLGTTGLTPAQKAEIAALGKAGRIVFAPNFSVGVNLLFLLARRAAEVLGEDFDIEIVEVHHNQKKDAPSGTAERLAEVVAAARGLDYAADTRHGRHGIVGARSKREIGMHAVRGGDVVGEHTVIFAAGGERVELTHRAHSRDTFVRGALRAARFLATATPGIYDMGDVLGLR